MSVGLDFEVISCSTPQIVWCNLSRNTSACSISSSIAPSSTSVNISSSSDCSLDSFSFKESCHCSSLSIAGPPVTVLASSTWCISLVAQDLCPARTFLFLARASALILVHNCM